MANASIDANASGDERAAGTGKINLLLTILRRFEVSARALASRPREEKRGLGYQIADEYDVQDLLYALLKPLCEDLEREDPVSKTAGDSGRVDLSSRSLGAVVEVKYASSKARAREIARECRERIVTYARWPELKHLVFFVYDPGHYLQDADNLISGLSQQISWGGRPFAVDCVVSPWQVGITERTFEGRSGSASDLPSPQPVSVDKKERTEGEDSLVVALGQAVYSRDYVAILIPFVLSNRSDRPNSIESVYLRIRGEEMNPRIPPAGLQYLHGGWFESAGLRLEPWGTAQGGWFFDATSTKSVAAALQKRVSACLYVAPVRGLECRIELEITPLAGHQEPR